MKEKTSVQYYVDKLLCYSMIIKQYLPLHCSARSGDASQSDENDNESGRYMYH